MRVKSAVTCKENYVRKLRDGNPPGEGEIVVASDSFGSYDSCGNLAHVIKGDIMICLGLPGEKARFVRRKSDAISFIHASHGCIETLIAVCELDICDLC